MTDPNQAGRANLFAANDARSVVARHRDVAAARDALSRVGATRTEAQQQALRARVERPDATLAELAGWIGWSKDRYAAVLRRALTTVGDALTVPGDGDALAEHVTAHADEITEALGWFAA